MTPCRRAQQVDRKGRGSVGSRRRGQTMGKVGEPPAVATSPDAVTAVAVAVVAKASVAAVDRFAALVALAVVSLGEARLIHAGNWSMSDSGHVSSSLSSCRSRRQRSSKPSSPRVRRSASGVEAETTVSLTAVLTVLQIRGRADPVAENPGMLRDRARRPAMRSRADLTVMSRRLKLFVDEGTS